MERQAGLRPRLGLAATPYVAVLVGLYGLGSAWVAVGMYHAGVLAFLARGGRWRSLANGWRASIGVPVIALCALSGPALALAYPVAQLPEPGLTESLRRFGLGAASWSAFVLYYPLVNPWLEEAAWRGRLGSSRTGVAWSDGAFAGYHVLVLRFFLTPAWVVVAFLVLVGAAWLWRRIAHARRGLAIPAVSHLVADASVMASSLWLTARES